MLDVVTDHYVIVFYGSSSNQQIKIIDPCALQFKMGFGIAKDFQAVIYGDNIHLVFKKGNILDASIFVATFGSTII